MGVLSNKHLENSDFDRETPQFSKKLKKHDKDYKVFRQKYKIDSPHSNVEPKSYYKELEKENELEI